jgi:hypothetical protein
MTDEIDDFFDKVRTHMRGQSPEFGDSLADDFESSFYGMYESSSTDPEHIEQVDELLHIIRSDSPFLEKYDAYNRAVKQHMEIGRSKQRRP